MLPKEVHSQWTEENFQGAVKTIENVEKLNLQAISYYKKNFKDLLKKLY